MTEPHHAGPPVLVALLAAVLLGCAGGGPAASPPSASAGVAAATEPAATDASASVPPANAESASAAPTPAPSGDDGTGGAPAGVPTACLTLAERDCVRARELALAMLDAADPAPTYVQVGPFGCATGDRCPSTLAARPEGDVLIESEGGVGINVHLVGAPDGAVDAARDAAMGIAVEPASTGELPAGPTELSLGHCGIFSGIDVAGSWWDPVGTVPMDTGDAINATPGVFTLLGEDTATFVAPTGFAIQLLRRDGPKLLPPCM